MSIKMYIFWIKLRVVFGKDSCYFEYFFIYEDLDMIRSSLLHTCLFTINWYTIFFSKSTECFCSKCIRNCQEIFLSKFTFLRPKVMRIAPGKKKSSRYRVLEKYHFHMKLSTRPGAEVSYKNVYIETSPLVQRDI